MAPRTRRLPRRPTRDRRREPVPGPVQGSVIRPAAAGDIATIVALRALMFESMGKSSEEISAIEWQQDTSRWLQLRLSSETTHVVVAEANGTVVSCAVGQVVERLPGPGVGGDAGHVSNIATFPRHRRLGFTHAVLGALIEWFEEETEVEVILLSATETGREIYEKFGFEESRYPQMKLRLERSVEPDED